MVVRWQLIKSKAQSILDELEITSAPVPIEACVRHLGATLRFEPLDGKSVSMLYRQIAGGAIVGVNSLQSEERKRWCIAHELGHLLLHSDLEMHVDECAGALHLIDQAPAAKEEKELEADSFASELLLPEGLLRRDFGVFVESGIELEHMVENLAKNYRVSLVAITLRLLRMGLVQ